MSEIKKEGELYKKLEIFGRFFELRYGYYEQKDRENPMVNPIPIYPDFLSLPEYTEDGRPFVTKMQDACLCYRGEVTRFAECGDCEHYSHGEELIGVCENRLNRREMTSVRLGDKK